VRSRWPALLVALLGSLALGACTATPITLPGQQDAFWQGTGDSGVRYDAPDSPAIDMAPPDMATGITPDAAEPDHDGASARDGTTDGVCFECPPPMPDGGAGDAEAGPPDDATTDDVMTDLFVGDLTVGE